MSFWCSHRGAVTARAAGDTRWHLSLGDEVGVVIGDLSAGEMRLEGLHCRIISIENFNEDCKLNLGAPNFGEQQLRDT